MKPIYRIIKNTFYEKYEVKTEYYSIQIQRKFLGFKYWSTLKNTQYVWIEKFRDVMSFRTESDAIYAIKKMMNGAKLEGWEETVSTILDFNRENK